MPKFVIQRNYSYSSQESTVLLHYLSGRTFRFHPHSKKVGYVYTGTDTGTGRNGFCLHRTVWNRSKCLHGTVLDPVRKRSKRIQKRTCKTAAIDITIDNYRIVQKTGNHPEHLLRYHLLHLEEQLMVQRYVNVSVDG